MLIFPTYNILYIYCFRMTRKWTSLLLISVIALALPTLASAQYARYVHILRGGYEDR